MREMSQGELDEAVGVPEGRTHSYERGLAQPSDEFLRRAAKALGVADWRICDSDDVLGAAAVQEVTFVPYWGIVPCGDWEPPTDVTDTVAVTGKVAGMQDVVAVRIGGESMAPLLVPGDVVPVKLTVQRTDGAIALVRNQDNDLTLKVTRYINGRWEFHPLNPHFQPVTAERVEMIGKVLHIPERFDPDGIAA